MKYSEKNLTDWSEKYKAPMTENYQAPENEFTGKTGNPLNYIEKRNRIQAKEASKIRSQAYKGRYE